MRFLLLFFLVIFSMGCSSKKILIDEITYEFKKKYPNKIEEYKSDLLRNDFRNRSIKKGLNSSYIKSFNKELVLCEFYTWGNTDIDEMQEMYFIVDNSLYEKVYYRLFYNRPDFYNKIIKTDKIDEGYVNEMELIKRLLNEKNYSALIDISKENLLDPGGNIYITILQKNNDNEIEIKKTMIIDLFGLCNCPPLPQDWIPAPSPSPAGDGN